MTQTKHIVTPDPLEMKRMVCAQLQTHGYTLEQHGYRQLVATKTFASVVGEKMAYVELTGFDNESVTLFLTANMESEGRNCLVGCASYIPKPLTNEAVSRCVAEFSESVNKTVAGLVIVRLMPRPASGLESAGKSSQVAL